MKFSEKIAEITEMNKSLRDSLLGQVSAIEDSPAYVDSISTGPSVCAGIKLTSPQTWLNCFLLQNLVRLAVSSDQCN